jgi:predicted nucleic-acid-binding Zn-ribbon protein
MSKEVSCYKCGNHYAKNSSSACPKCGEARIFEASKDDPKFDMYSDVSRVGRNRILGVIVVGAIWASLTIYLSK